MSITLLNGSREVPFALELDQDGEGKASNLRLRSTERGSAKAEFMLKPLDIPTELLEPDGNNFRLKTIQEIRQEVAAAVDAAEKEKQIEAPKIEAKWHAFVNALSMAQFSLDTNEKFLGAVIFPGDAKNIVGTVNLNLGACLLDNTYSLNAQFEIAAECNVILDGATIVARMAWRLAVNKESLLPQMAIQLPGPGMRFPEFEFPDFSWDRLALPAIPVFDLALPTLPGIPLEIKHKGVSFVAQYTPGTGALQIDASVKEASLNVFGSSCELGDPKLSYDNGQVSISGFKVSPAPIEWVKGMEFALPSPLGAVSCMLGAGNLQIAVVQDSGRLVLKGVLKQEITVYPTSQPTKLLKLGLILPFVESGFTTEVTIGGTTTKRDVKLLAPGAETLLEALLEHLPMPGSVAINLRLPALSLPGIDALVEVLSALLAAIANGLAGLARIVEAGLRALFSLLRKAAAALSELEITLILDARTGHVQQVLLGLRRKALGPETIFESAGFMLTAPLDADLALLIDLRNGERDAYLIATTQTQNAQLLALGTDLWFGSASQELPASNVGTPGKLDGANASSKLISVAIKTKKDTGANRFSVVPFGIRHGEAVFFHALARPLPPLGTRMEIGFDGYQLTELSSSITATASFKIDTLKKRFLPFLAAPQESAAGGGGLGDLLKQYIQIDGIDPLEPTLEEGKFKTQAQVTIKLMGSKIKSNLGITLDPRRMTVDVSGGEIKISLTDDTPLELFGMKALFLDADDKPVASDQFVLDMRSADTRMYLNDKLKMVLDFSRLGTDAAGKPLQFEVSKLVVHGGGLDLDAKLRGPYTIRINGLETDFTFEAATLKVRGGRVDTFSLVANGKLPPALLGDVAVRLQLDFGERKDGSFGLLDGGIELKNKGKPIRSEETHFVFTLDALTVRLFEDGGSLHFCAFLSGSAAFKPEDPALSEGMLKKLAGLELKFTDCPICGASDVIRRELEKLNLSFVVALNEPIKATLFEMFTFEVRSIGFEPKSAMWDDRPAALILGGQIEFSLGDVIRAECDFHKLYIAPPESGKFLPRLRCEGLGLALRLYGTLEIEGKVVAVDGRMPNDVLNSEAPGNRIKGNGFMGQGRVAIQGLPPFAASFGFVEIEIPETRELKRAWFVYLEAQHLSYYFQLGPVPLYLREAGLGLGFHFTYVGIEAVDNAKSLPEMIRGVDTIAAAAVEPGKLDAWRVSGQEGLTLVARVLISMSSASAPSEPLVYKPDEEKELPNLVLLNAVAAMRNSTFLLTSTAWLGYNYHDWDHGRNIGKNDLVGKHTMVGYVILVGARSEFLARLKSNPGAEVGPRLPLPQQFKDALKDIEYEATLYIRPGLLHFELGWPNRIRWSKNFAGMNVNVAGGAIFRVYEGALLVGLNLEGNLNFSLSGQLDAGVVGVAVSASVYAALTARIIGYLDSQNVNNSLYYSLFSLQVQVKFEVSGWLKIDTWFCKITIPISFALSLQIDVVSELALQGDIQMGARVRATIVVSIFGRSLGLSVGLSFNPGLVDNAASRVGRFMNMGLMQEVPSVTPDFVEQDKANATASEQGGERREARAAAGAANPSDSGLAPVPHEDPLPPDFTPPPVEAIEIMPTDFQIVLTYPKAQPISIKEPIDLKDWVYLTFLPLDAVPGEGKDPQVRSSFYAAPPYQTAGTVPDHKIEFPSQKDSNTKEYFYFKDGSWTPADFSKADWKLETVINWDVTLPYTQSTEGSTDGSPIEVADSVATLRKLFFAAFRTPAVPPAEVNDGVNRYMEPNARPRIKGKFIERISRTMQQQHGEQERAYNKNMKQDPADRRCHEARDFLMQMFVSDLFQLAADGVVPKTAHVAHLGLTLLVRRSLAEAFSVDGVEIVVKKRIGAGKSDEDYYPSKPCEVFNPPKLMFAYEPPRFDKVAYAFEDNKARLDWDLNWSHEDEPEHFVQHYELKRWIEVDGKPEGEAWPITFKRADKVEETVDERDVKSRIVVRGSWQYTDEFEDMSASAKARLFDPFLNAVLRYTVVPVCISGTRGVPCSDFILTRVGLSQLTRIKHASAILHVNPRPLKSDPEKVTSIDLTLRLEAGTDLIAEGDMRYWRLVLRSEALVPSGQYGLDGQTTGRLSTTVGAEVTLRHDDIFYSFKAGADATFPRDGDDHASINKLVPDLLKELQDVKNPRAFILFAQSYVNRGDKEIASSPLVLVELGIEIIKNDSDTNINETKDRIMARVDALELVRLPFNSEMKLLGRVEREDLFVLPGRAALREPVPNPLKQMTGNSVLHPEFGGITALNWNLRPSVISDDDIPKYRLLSGFDVFTLDMDNGDQPDKPESWSKDRVRRVTSARLLSPEHMLLTPSEVGEPSNWKVRYPSQRERRLAGGAWYSPAESRIKWPYPDIRREPLPEPTSELIKALLREGRPDYIKLEMKNSTDSAGFSWGFLLKPADLGVGWKLSADDNTRYSLVYSNDQNTQGVSAAAGLRIALRALQANPTHPKPEKGYTLKDKRGWMLKLTPGWQKEVNNAVPTIYELTPPEQVHMHFDRELHPLLEAVMARIRRMDAEEGRKRLLDLDRRPIPVVQAETVDDFIAATGDAADPYGWAILDRLGLGVTLRLFDPVDDAFLSPKDMYTQLSNAIAEVKSSGLYRYIDNDIDNDLFKHLFVEVLLQPGSMMEREEFSTVPDRNGVLRSDVDPTLVQSHRLAMLRLSLRPAIEKDIEYMVWNGYKKDASDKKLGDVGDVDDCFFPQKNKLYDKIKDKSLKTLLEEVEKEQFKTDPEPNVYTVILRGLNIKLEGGVEDKKPGKGTGSLGYIDAFGRVPPRRWKPETDHNFWYFHTSLLNAGIKQKDDTPNNPGFSDTQWQAMNARFFEYAADPAPEENDAGFTPQYAFSAVDATEPVMVAANSAGQLSVLVPETDGYAHMRAFAVLPQWRYAQLLKDAGYDELDDLMAYTRRAGGSNTATPPENRYAISTVLRTAPIQPAEVLAVGRIGDTVWWSRGLELKQEGERSAAQLRAAGYARLGTDPGNGLPVVVRHHEELRQSKNNVKLARALSLSGSLTTFVLTIADHDWCKRFLDLNKLEPQYRLADPLPVEDSPNTLDDVASLLDDPPVDAKVRVMRHLPHWYRHAVVLSAGAGSAVAETVSSYLAEAPSRLVEIKLDEDDKPYDVSVKSGHPWEGMIKTIDLVPVVLSGDKPSYSRFEISIPALRYRDTTDATTAAIWAGKVANLADPGVAYELELEVLATPMRPRKVVTPLARVMRTPANQTASVGTPGKLGFSAFPLSGEWLVDCTFDPDESDEAKHTLSLTVTPMSLPVTVSDESLKTLLANSGYLNGSVLRVPGGWSEEWLDYFAGKFMGADPAASLSHVLAFWRALAVADAGVPDADFAGLTIFPAYSVGELRLNKPVNPEGWTKLATALTDWVGQLAGNSSELAKLVHDRFAPFAITVAAGTWPFIDDDPLVHVERLPWVNTMPEPDTPCEWSIHAPQMLMPELMTDEQYDNAMASVGDDVQLESRLTALRAAQRERALAGGALRIRATRGDAIPLELALISLTPPPDRFRRT